MATSRAGTECTVTLVNTKVGEKPIRTSRLFKEYMEGLDPRWTVIDFRVSWAVPRRAPGTGRIVDIVMMFAEITGLDGEGRDFRTGALLRGKTTEILPIIVAPNGKRYVALVTQPRGAVGTDVTSTPAGMVDGNELRFTVFNELSQEVGLELNWSEPLSLNGAVTGNNAAFYVSPGGSNERVVHYAVEAHVNWAELHMLQGNQGGAADENEHTVVMLLPYDDFPAHYGAAVPVPCEKTLSTWLMHNYAMSRGSTS